VVGGHWNDGAIGGWDGAASRDFLFGCHPEWPPLPANVSQAPVWSLGNGFYLADDRGINDSCRNCSGTGQAQQAKIPMEFGHLIQDIQRHQVILSVQIAQSCQLGTVTTFKISPTYRIIKNSKNTYVN
jgi:hypothetical protein